MLMALSTIVMGQNRYQKNIDKARAGDATAQVDVGYAYETGDGVAKDLKKAVSWYRKSADQGHKIGQCNLGICYENGIGVEKNPFQAFYWYKKAAEQGYRNAQANLGTCYYNGFGVAKDYNQAFSWYIKAAAQGMGSALFNLGLCYDYARGVAKDLSKALYYYREALAKGGLSQTNIEWANNRIKTLTDSGYTAKSDEVLQEAIKKLKAETIIDDKQKYDQNIAAARQGDAEAQFQVAMSLNDKDEALVWLRKAGEQGQEGSLYILTIIYSGEDKEYRSYANKEEFRHFMEVGYRHINDGKFNVKLLTMLGLLYYTNSEIRDDKKALEFFRKAVEHPNPNNVGWLACAEGMIGVFYMNGTEVEQDDTQAFTWFKKSVSHGVSDKRLCGYQRFLGICYYNGEGTQQDNDQALYWFEQAVSNGDEVAEPWLERAQKRKQEILLAQSQQKKAPVEERLPALPTKGAVTNVDENIPQTTQQDTRTYAVIIGNELYENEAQVPFAENDAKIFKDYVQQTLGLPENHIRLITNAGLNRIRGAVRWLKEAMEAQSGQGKIILYYAGHGIPDEANKDAYLLPVDGIGSDVESAYPLNRLYKELSALPAERVTVFLDACFSGAKREGDMMASARGIAIKVKETAPQGKMVVFTAAQGDETAYPFKSQKHGMFTYYLLKKLQETQGKATLGELGDYLTTEVKRQSFVENNKVQTPTIVPSAGLQNTWRGLTLK